MLKRTLVVTIVMFLVIACAPVTAPQPLRSAAKPTDTTLDGSQPGVVVVAEGTGSCSGTLTSANQEGPYYSAGSPLRASLVDDGLAGKPVLINGRVFDVDCAPISGVKIDFWQADADGKYDNVGFTLRGHVLTDETGQFSIETIVPGLYTGRPPHIHVKVFAADGRELLTTQMYFTGSEQSADVQEAPDLFVHDGQLGEDGRSHVRFDFVVQQ